MADFAKMVVLAVMPRDAGFIVIALRVDEKAGLIRLLASDQSRAIAAEDCVLDVGRPPEPLDVIRVGIKKRSPQDGQPENCLTDCSLRWILLRRADAIDVAAIRIAGLDSMRRHPFALGPAGGASGPPGSIAVLDPETVRFAVDTSSDGAWFECVVNVATGAENLSLPLVDLSLLDQLAEVGSGEHRPTEAGFNADDHLLLVVTAHDYLDSGEADEVFCAGVLAVPGGLYTDSSDVVRLAVHPVPPDERMNPPVGAQGSTIPPSRPKAWTEAQSKELCHSWGEGATLKELAVRFDRTCLAVGARLMQLGYDPNEDRESGADSGRSAPPPASTDSHDAPTSPQSTTRFASADPSEGTRSADASGADGRATATDSEDSARWARDEDEELLRLWRLGASNDDMSARLGRDGGAVALRLKMHVREANRAREEERLDALPSEIAAALNATSPHERLTVRLRLDVTAELLERFERNLDPRHRDVLERRFGMRSFQPMSISAISRDLSLSEGRVRELESTVLGSLRGFVEGWAWALRDSRAADSVARCPDSILPPDVESHSTVSAPAEGDKGVSGAIALCEWVASRTEPLTGAQLRAVVSAMASTDKAALSGATARQMDETAEAASERGDLSLGDRELDLVWSGMEATWPRRELRDAFHATWLSLAHDRADRLADYCSWCLEAEPPEVAFAEMAFERLLASAEPKQLRYYVRSLASVGHADLSPRIAAVACASEAIQAWIEEGGLDPLRDGGVSRGSIARLREQFEPFADGPNLAAYIACLEYLVGYSRSLATQGAAAVELYPCLILGGRAGDAADLAGRFASDLGIRMGAHAQVTVHATPTSQGGSSVLAADVSRLMSSSLGPRPA